MKRLDCNRLPPNLAEPTKWDGFDRGFDLVIRPLSAQPHSNQEQTQFKMKGVRSSQALARQSASLQRRWASQFSSAQAGGLNIAASEETAAPTSAITVALRAGPRYESSPGAAHVLKNYMFRVRAGDPARPLTHAT